jgi:glycogen debranching enzyme
LDRWLEVLQGSASLGYNAIHLTPVQELGESQSSYSIYEQVSVSPWLFPTEPNLEFATREQRLKQVLDTLHSKSNLLLLSDVVWNHTANNSTWLASHPEVGYNLENSPHLKCAFELDEALMKMSEQFVEGKLFDKVILQGNELIFKPFNGRNEPSIDTEEDVQHILNKFKLDVWPSLKLWQYFVVDVVSTVQQFREVLLSGRVPISDELKEHLATATWSTTTDHIALELLRAKGIEYLENGERFSTHINMDVALSLYNVPPIGSAKDYPSERDFEAELDLRCRRFKAAVDEINLPLYLKYDKDLETIVQNLYHRMRRGKITKHDVLFETYFTRVRITDANGKETIIPLANNGWIWNGNPMVDFASSKSESYYLREVIVWGDCVKLRYGAKREDNPWLWDRIFIQTF